MRAAITTSRIGSSSLRRFSLSERTRFQSPPLPGLADGGSYSTGNYFEGTRGAVLGYTFTISPTMVNEFRAGFNSNHYSDNIPAYGQNYPPEGLAVPGVPNNPTVNGLDAIPAQRLQETRRARLHSDLQHQPGIPVWRHTEHRPRKAHHQARAANPVQPVQSFSGRPAARPLFSFSGEYHGRRPFGRRRQRKRPGGHAARISRRHPLSPL